MSDIRKWLKIMESVPSVFPDQPTPDRVIKQDATVMVNPRVGGGAGRYMHSTPNGAMVDIKGVARELPQDDFGLPERDYEDPYQKGNDWFHMSQEPDSPGRMNDKPEFRSGDMIKIADVYGTVIGPGMGVFVAYGTTGKDAVVSFDGKEMLVPVANIAAALEQNSKDNFGEMDNDGNLSPMSFGSENRVKELHIEKQEPAMDHRDEFSKWMSTVEEAMTGNMPSSVDVGSATPTMECGGCGNWDCADCFPDEHGQEMQMDPEIEVDLDPSMVMMPDSGGNICPQCGHSDDGHMHDDEVEFEVPMEDGSAGGMGAGGMASGPVEMEEEEQEFIEKGSSGKGVKLGDIVTKTEFRKTGGQNSPMTYGDNNLDEDDIDSFNDAYGSSPDMYDDINTGEMIINIMNMQNNGLGHHDEDYTEEQLKMMSPEQLKKAYDQVMGVMSEEPDNIGFEDEMSEPEQEMPPVPEVSPQQSPQNMAPSDAMRELMNRMNSSIGNDEQTDEDDGVVIIVAKPGQATRVQGQAQGNPGMSSNLPQMSESKRIVYVKPTLYEQIKWDDELKEAFAEAEAELDESSLSKLIGKNKGGQQLVRWLHKKHKLANDAELEPVPFNKELLWSQFKSHPDDFVIVSGQNGAAGIKPDQKHIEKMTQWKEKKGQTYNPGRDATLPYQIIAFTGDGEQVDPELLRPTNEPGEEPTERNPDPTVIKGRMGKTIGKDIQNSNNTFALLNDQIGPLTTVWITGFAGYRGDPESIKEPIGSVERDKMQKRADLKKDNSGSMDIKSSVDKIQNKIRPVLKTLADQALASIMKTAKGYQDDNDFDSAQQVMANAGKLKQFQASLDSPDAAVVKDAILKAISSASGEPIQSQEASEWASRAAQGNSQALKPILDALRQTLTNLS